MNVLGTAFDVPVVTYGPGEPHASHTANEHVEIAEYVSSIDVFSRALFHLSRLHNNAKERTLAKIEVRNQKDDLVAVATHIMQLVD